MGSGFSYTRLFLNRTVVIVDSDFKIVVAEEVSQYCGFGYASAKGSFNQAYSDYSRPISWQLVELKGSRSF